MSKTKPKRELRKLADLSDYPLQIVYAATTTQQDDDDLQTSIENDGLKDIIKVLPENKAGLPAGTIFDGHRRRDALLRSGEDTVTVLVLNDLANADRETIDRLFVEENSIRRQLDPIAKAYIAAKQCEIAHGRTLDELDGGWETEELRERVGKMLGISGRHLSRLMNVIRTPIEVQAAVRKKKLAIVMAEKVASLPKDQQNKIAERIRAGDDAKAVVESFLGPAIAKPKTVETAYRRYLKALTTTLQYLPSAVKDIRFGPKEGELKILGDASELNTALANQLQAHERRTAGLRDRSLNAMSDELDGQ